MLGKTNMTVPVVSVVMSVFNGERFLEEAVESILNQSYREFEFILINDGSTDRSGEIMESFANKDSRLHVYHQENKGFIEALNRGCTLARGKYIARSDADDIAMRDRLTWQVEFIEKHPEVGIVGGAVEVIDSTGKTLETSVNPVDDRQIRSALLRGECPFWNSTVLMRKDAFVSAGEYRRIFTFAEDHDLFLRIADRYKLSNLTQILTKYRLHPGQMTVRHSEQAALSLLATLASAAARRTGRPDPLDDIKEITPASLIELGVSEAVQQATLAERYSRAVGTMCDAGEYSMALNMLEQMNSSCDLNHAKNKVVADLRLMAARASWHQGRYMRSALSAGQALLARPIILGRPLRPLLRRLRIV
jgi:Glycosyl transferase family 2